MSEIVTNYSPVPPHNIEAERSVLGALLQDSTLVATSMELLAESDFYAPQHKTIFESMHALYAKSLPIDLITMDAELSKKGVLSGIGGTEYLIAMTQDVPSTLNTPYYIAILREKSTLRKLIHASNVIMRMCYEQQEELPTILGRAEKEIFDITMRQDGGQDLVHIKEVLQKTYSDIEELARLKGQVSGVPTGFIELDRLLTGLHGGELILVGARPSMGKTSFIINIASYAANHAKKVAVFSLEMPREQIAMRILCGDAKVDMQNVRRGVMSDEEWMRLARTLAPLSNAELYIDDTASITPMQIRSRCRRLMLEKGLDLIIIDYLQLMSSDGKSENRQLEVSEISRRLKAIALELRIPLIAAAQLSRANMQRATKTPMLSDLRDSGSIEQDADVVMFLHREDYYNQEKEKVNDNTAQVILAKQRNGPLGTVELAWLSEYTLFANMNK